MDGFTRRQIVEILELEETFVVELENEAILFPDTPGEGPVYSLRMLERARVAQSLVGELEVNLAGVAVILRMREELGQARSVLRELAGRLHDQGVKL